MKYTTTHGLTIWMILFSILSLSSAQAQESTSDINQTMTDSRGNTHLIGVTSSDALRTAPFDEWYVKNYDEYTPDTKILNAAKSDYSDLSVLAFMGTWCGDSKREVPKFYKVAKQLGLSEEQIKMVNVYRDSERYKMSPTGEEKGLNIHRVPTFVFYKNGEEVGRIVESPVTNMETDVAQILMGVPTKPKYTVVAYLNEQFESGEHDMISEKEEAIARFAARRTTSSSELNTYGYILITQDRMSEAIQVLKINNIAYPQDANTFDSLAEAYRLNGDRTEAVCNYIKALEVDPNLETAIVALKELQEELEDKTKM